MPPEARAVWFGGPRQVELRPESLPAVSAGEVRVRAIASGLSHGTEMLVYRGQVPPDLPLDLPTFRGSFRFPVKHGYAGVGRIVAVGTQVDALHEGDLVFALHPHQSEYVLPASLVTALPPDLDPALGVFTANLETAITVLLDAAPRLGERVAVFGQGVVGLLLTQLLRRAGAGLIIAVEPMPRRQELARQVGADAILVPDAALPECIRDLTAGLGADLAIEASGSAAALDSAVESVAAAGTVVVASWYGTKPVTLHLGGHFHRGRVRIVSSQVGTIDPTLSARWSPARRRGLARTLLPQLALAPLITHRIPFERASEAYELVDRHPEETAQVILTYDAG